MIKAIIFDCFGVLTADLWLQFKEKHFAGKPDLAEQATELNKQADRGFIDYESFKRHVADLAGIPAAEINFLPNTSAANDLLFSYISDFLRPKYKLAILSNASGNFMDRLFLPHQAELFDEVVLSCDVGMIKPQREMYELTAEKLGTEIQECVFVDDREGACSAARALGMPAVWYQGFTQFKTDLEQILYHT